MQILIVAALVVLAIPLILAAAWGVFILLKTLLDMGRDEAHVRAERRKHLRPDGQPYPPTGTGLCDQCGRAPGAVYFLPDGKRLCQGCYDAADVATRDAHLETQESAP
ncbi:MAG: hypothetical protein GVY16_02425 [Planctomycetes bacterium]|jgi:hypothetical protein|nr:hypothetical protein [Planctomycetota bacterium]